MKHLLRSVLCLLLLASAVAGQEKKSGGAPPIIDRELIFGNPEIAGAQISPNGQYIAFLKPWKDTRNIYVKAVERAIQRGPAADDGDQAPRGRLSSGRGTANTSST